MTLIHLLVHVEAGAEAGNRRFFQNVIVRAETAEVAVEIIRRHFKERGDRVIDIDPEETRSVEESNIPFPRRDDPEIFAAGGRIWYGPMPSWWRRLLERWRRRRRSS